MRIRVRRENMKVSSSTMLVVWWCLMMMVLLIMSSSMNVEADECGQEVSYNTVSFDLNTGLICYKKFLTRFRNRVEAPTRACGLQFTRKVALKGREYMTVDLKIGNRQRVTLGIDTRDLYIWGYQDKFNGISRATFVNDVPQAARDALFSTATIKRTTSFKGTYPSLEKYAKVNKKNVALTIEGLRGAILDVYGKPEDQLNNAKEAKFFLSVVLMVAEAARFKFIENGILDKTKTHDCKLEIPCFVNDWGKISNAIHRAEAVPKHKCTKFDPAFSIGNIECKKTITSMSDLADYMALLRYYKPPASLNLADYNDIIGQSNAVM